MSDTTTPTTALTQGFSITAESVQQLLSYLEKGQAVAVAELEQITAIQLPAQPSPEDIAACQKVKADYVEKLSKCKMVYEKMMAKRKAFTDPIKERLTQLMQFENALDPTKSDNEYAKARKKIEDFDNQLLRHVNAKKQEAELEKRKAQYRVDARAAIEKRLLEMMTGQEKTLTQGMINWEGTLTLENIDQKEASLKAVPLALKQEHYDKCFSIEFNVNKHLMTDEEAQKFIDELKKELTYALYNEQYLQMAAPIKNAYLAKLPDVKANLIKIKDDAAAQAKRKADLEAEGQSKIKEIEQAADAKLDEIEHKKEMGGMEAEFIQQGMTQDLPSQATKKVASFENDAMWLKPLLEVISHVAINGNIKVKNSKGEWVPQIQKWLTDFEKCHGGKVIAGLKMEDEAKTQIRAK